MEAVFYCSAFLVGYVFIGYPLLLQVLTRACYSKEENDVKQCADTGSLPSVSVVIAAHNEQLNIAKRLDNLFAQNYPLERLQVIVGSDGSSDSTASILGDYKVKSTKLGVDFEFFEFAERGGKPKVLNHAIGLCKHSLVVFTDARQTFSDNAVLALVSRFSDAEVGAVNGELFLKTVSDELGSELTGASEIDGEVSDGASMGWYWRYEKSIRKAEAVIHSTVGATGAIYAIRKELYQDIPDNTLIDDVVIPMQICMQGYRVVFEENARAFDVPPTSGLQEWVRKVRTLAGNWQLFAIRPEFFHPVRNPVFFQFISHKILRLVAPFCLLLLLISSFLLAYTELFVLQSIFYLVGFLTFYIEGMKRYRLANLISFFCILNCAIIFGLLRLVFQSEKSLWKFAYKPK